MVRRLNQGGVHLEKLLLQITHRVCAGEFGMRREEMENFRMMEEMMDFMREHMPMMGRRLDEEEVMKEGHHYELVTNMLGDMMGMMEMMAHLEMMLEDGAGARTKYLLFQVFLVVEHAEKVFQEALCLFGEGKVGAEHAKELGDVRVRTLRLQVVVGRHRAACGVLVPFFVVIDESFFVFVAGVVTVQGLIGSGEVSSPRHSCKQQKPFVRV